MTDIQLLDKFLDCPFPDPVLFREIRSRGLYSVIEHAPIGKQGKSYVRAKLAEKGKFIGDPEIEEIADMIDRLKFLQSYISGADVTSPNDYINYLGEMKQLAENLRDYYK